VNSPVGGPVGGRPTRLRHALFLMLGPALALLVYFLLPHSEALTHAGRATAAVAVLMTVWWLAEVIPLEVAGLMPLVLLPALGVMDLKRVAPAYADPIILLFLGGMLLGQALERWGLHRRIGLSAVALLGSSPSRLVAAILAATAFMSMWVSNTAAAVMMLPIATSVVSAVKAETSDADPRLTRNLGLSLVLAVAYGASIGGVGTLIGTPPTAQIAAFANSRYGAGSLTFAQWLVVGVPAVVLCCGVAWVLLTRFLYPVRGANLASVHPVLMQRRRELGRMSSPEWRVLVIFAATAAAWIAVPMLESVEPFRAALVWVESSKDGTVIAQWARASDTAIAIAGALLLFIVPAGVPAGSRERRGDAATRADVAPPRPLLTWAEGSQVPWGVLLLFGGGLALAKAIEVTGFDKYLAGFGGALTDWPSELVVAFTVVAATFLSEVTSNTAQTAIMLPVGAAFAQSVNAPAGVVLIPGVLGACLAFMLPGGTPPNAVVFSSRLITIRQMAWAGLWMNLACAVVVVGLVLVLRALGWLPGLGWR